MTALSPGLRVADVPVGAFGLSQIGGALGLGIRVGQALIGDWSRYTHAFVVVDNRADGLVVQAMPHGAEFAPLAPFLDGRPVAFSWALGLREVDAARIEAFAEDLVGTPYGFSDYAALALSRFGVRPAWLRRYLAGNGRMICSQLVDEVYRRAGISLFDDGRPAHEVTPGDLANVLIERDWRALA